jgi:hypothetical protein
MRQIIGLLFMLQIQKRIHKYKMVIFVFVSAYWGNKNTFFTKQIDKYIAEIFGDPYGK